MRIFNYNLSPKCKERARGICRLACQEPTVSDQREIIEIDVINPTSCTKRCIFNLFSTHDKRIYNRSKHNKRFLTRPIRNDRIPIQ
jgi:hypothetical protein